METTATDIESVTLSDVLGLGSWNRQRSTVELRSFINEREEALDVEDFNLD
jgi:hypothetical protein